MTETKFTQGPWTTPHFARPDTNCQCEYVLAEHGGMGAVASVYCSGDGDDWMNNGDNPKFEEAVANAHLIAAAPELYEALAESYHNELWNAYNTGHVSDGKWTHCFMSDGEWLVRQCGLDPLDSYYDNEELKQMIPEVVKYHPVLTKARGE